MKSFLNTLLPKFLRLPLLLVVVINMAVYFIPSRLLVTDVDRFDLSLALDYALPLVPFFVVFYVLAYVQWVGSYLYHCRESVQLCYRIVVADIIAKLICLVFFLFLPTRIARPEIVGGGAFEWATGFMYSIDEPVNLFPSIHCLESWMCFRGAMMLQKKNKAYITVQGVLAVLVCLSTVFIKQHFIVDIPAGILACEIGLFLSCRCGAWRLGGKLQTPSAKAQLEAQGYTVLGERRG